MLDVQRLKYGYIQIDLGVTDWSEVVPRMVGAWPVVAAEVERVSGAKPTLDWDRIRMYVRFGSGMIGFSLDPERPKKSGLVAGICVRCVEELYYEMPDPEVDPEGFERAHEAMDRRLFEALRESALLPGPRAALGALQQLRRHAITFVQYDDLETERTLVDAGELGGDV